ncbi:cathepsin E [Corchorus olitorius]|uniref:Cathepsin E n=1 Tax=Corchorus olitorius TaxID=93759 RepID=A0A1R3L1Q6_9ROSI|nr:cathepsin E [Corchorus olitorius]
MASYEALCVGSFIKRFNLELFIIIDAYDLPVTFHFKEL